DEPRCDSPEDRLCAIVRSFSRDRGWTGDRRSSVSAILVSSAMRSNRWSAQTAVGDHASQWTTSRRSGAGALHAGAASRTPYLPPPAAPAPPAAAPVPPPAAPPAAPALPLAPADPLALPDVAPPE